MPNIMDAEEFSSSPTVVVGKSNQKKKAQAVSSAKRPEPKPKSIEIKKEEE